MLGNKLNANAMFEDEVGSRIVKSHLKRPPKPHDNLDRRNHHDKHLLLSGTRIQVSKEEEPDSKAHMKGMAARAFCVLVKGNISVLSQCSDLCSLAILSCSIKKSSDDVRYHSAMALMEITVTAEQEIDLRRGSI